MAHKRTKKDGLSGNKPKKPSSGNSGPNSGGLEESKSVRVTCKTADSLPLDEIRDFQGDLKTLSEKDFAKLKASIVQHGLSFPSFVWRKNGAANCLDGHQRNRVLTKMRDEGWKVPPIPIVYVEARNEKEAKEKVLLVSSQYGRYSMESVYGFASEAGLDFDELSEEINLPQFDWNKFRFGWVDDRLPEIQETKRSIAGMSVELVNIDDLKPHPRNYREHPEDQIQQFASSVREHGFYKPAVLARDNTILAGHGITLALKQMGIASISAVRLDLDPDDPKALKILVGDNELDHLAHIDDRSLTEILRDIKDVTSLDGTGYDEMMLANLVFVTRRSDEMRDRNEAAEWVGMPEYSQPDSAYSLMLNFRNMADRRRFVETHKDVIPSNKMGASRYDAMSPGVAQKQIDSGRQSDRCPYCEKEIQRKGKKKRGDKLYDPICPEHGSVFREDAKLWTARWPYEEKHDHDSLRWSVGDEP